MKYEILAFVVNATAPLPEGAFDCVEIGGTSAILIPVKSSWGLGKSARRLRLAAAPERQRLLESLMCRGTVLPFAPGSAIDRGDVSALVAANAPLVKALGDRFSGRVQYQVTVSWAEDRVLDHFRSSPELAPLFSNSTVSPAAISGAVSALAERLSRTMTSKVAAVACDLAELPREPAMLANCVVLLRNHDEMALDTALEAIDAMWPEGLRIRQIGPSPAVSFTTLRLKRIEARDIDAAFRCLGVPDGSHPQEIREARQRLLRRPDADVTRIRAAAEIAEAAHRAGECEYLHLIDLWSEGRSAHPGLEDVA